MAVLTSCGRLLIRACVVDIKVVQAFEGALALLGDA